MSKVIMVNGAQYRCNVPDNASPCIEDSRFNPDLSTGTVNGRVVREVKQLVVMGQILPWVGIESRDQFVAVNDAAKKQNALDREYLTDFLEGIGIDIPANATLGELGKTFNRHDPRLAYIFAPHGVRNRKTRTFGFKKGAKPPEVPDDEITQVKEWLNDNGVAYHPRTGLDKLLALKAAKEAELTEPDPDDV